MNQIWRTALDAAGQGGHRAWLMSRIEKLIERILSGQSDNSVTFVDAVKALEHAGFKADGGKGSHRVFRSNDGRHFSLPVHGNPIKPIYVRHIRALLLEDERS